MSKDLSNRNKHDGLFNPWAGLASYQDPEYCNQKLKFCGRDDESYDVAQLITNNIFITLYGKSGIGKTSLINAGVFPRLRTKRYMPISIRLLMDARDISFQQCILNQLNQAIASNGCLNNINVVPLVDDEHQPEFLWSFFARSQFLDNNGRIIFPVIVFDQFEEVFRERREEAEILLRQIAYLMDESHALSNRMVDGVRYKYDFNFRFVVSIREDDLYRLEDSIDNNYLFEMKRCRYRLRSLSEQGAREAIFLPGSNFFNPEDVNTIIPTIINIARNKEDRSISTNILSLVCSRIFVEFSQTNDQYIRPSLVESFIKGDPFEKFYNEATQGFSNKEKAFIEDNFVDSSGRRNSVSENDFLKHVKNGTLLLDGNRKILQRISTSSDGSTYRIELIHDSFCAPLATLKQKRERRQRFIWTSSLIAIVLLCISVTVWIWYQSNLIDSTEKSLNVSEKQREKIRKEKEISDNKNDSISKLNDSLFIQKEIIEHQRDSLNTNLAKLQEQFNIIKQQEREINIKDSIIQGRYQMGYIKTLGKPNRQGKRVSGVAIKVLGEPNVILSNANGEFYLNIPHGKEFVISQVSKLGYTLISESILNTKITSSSKPIVLVVEESSILDITKKYLLNSYKTYLKFKHLQDSLEQEIDSLNRELEDCKQNK